MSPEHTLQLFESFPHLFRGKDKPLTESRMSEGFICEDGWFELIRVLSQAIEVIAYAEGREPGSDQWPEALQVKEKFGRLRFHIEYASSAMHRAIDEAGNRSEQTCEICGAPGRRYGTSDTRCAAHADSKQER